jgi:ATP-dependent protease Clp ATPase subunit
MEYLLLLYAYINHLQSIGFGAKVSAPVTDQPSFEGLNDVTEQDLIRYGLIPEFVGTFF